MRFWYLVRFSLKESTARAFAVSFRVMRQKIATGDNNVFFRTGASYRCKTFPAMQKTGSWYNSGSLFKIYDEHLCSAHPTRLFDCPAHVQQFDIWANESIIKVVFREQNIFVSIFSTSFAGFLILVSPKRPWEGGCNFVTTVNVMVMGPVFQNH